MFETEPNLNEHNEKPNKECKAPTETIEGKRNILNRDGAQLIQDQAKDVTLSNLKVLDMAPLETEGFFRVNNVLMHRKFNKYPHDGLFYVDRIVVPEVYRPEILSKVPWECRNLPCRWVFFVWLLLSDRFGSCCWYMCTRQIF